MLVSLEMAATQFETNERYLYSDPKYNKYITKTKRGSIRFDIDAFEENEYSKQEEINFCIDMTNFAEFLIDTLGKDVFYSKFPSQQRQEVKRGLERNKLSLLRAELVETTFQEWYESYLNYEEVKSEYIPLEKRKPLTASFIIHNYWSSQKTTLEIAEYLNVPESWVIGEIRRLGLQKRANGIIVKGGLKDTIMSKEEREKRENQPHAKAIVQICPKTFEIIREYSSQGAVNRYGFKRENVRKAIKRGGLSKGFLWSFKGLEQATINIAKRRGNLEVKLQAAKYIPPTKKELYNLYIVQGKTSTQIAHQYKCHKNTIARLCSKFKLHKPKTNLTIEKLKKLYQEEKLLAKDIAKMYGLSVKTIASYLSRNGIKKYKK